MKASVSMLAKFGEKIGISAGSQQVMLGDPAAVIRAQAEEINADLIVLGSHGRSGWRVLLGSTANSVLHGANCDVLTVRVGTEENK